LKTSRISLCELAVSVEQEPLVLAVHDEHGRIDIQRVARLLAGFRLPGVNEERVQRAELLSVLVRRRAVQFDESPVYCGGLALVARRQPRRFGVIEIRENEYGCRVLDESIRQLFEA